MTQLIQAKNYTHVPNGRVCDLVVIHTMEAPEKPGTAASVARWFASATAPKASAHYCVDDMEVIQCVLERDIAWAAPGANKNGIHIEHAGYAKQSAEDWSDEFSQKMLAHSAQLCARICQAHNIPMVRLTPAQLIQGGRGICGHVDVTQAFHRSTHVDPGGEFPWTQYLGLVRLAMRPDLVIGGSDVARK